MVKTFRFLRKCIKVAAFPAHDDQKNGQFSDRKTNIYLNHRILKFQALAIVI